MDFYDEYIKTLLEQANEYGEELKKLNKRKEKYIKNEEGVPEKLNKRIKECDILNKHYTKEADKIAKSKIESRLDRMRHELNIPLGHSCFNQFSNMFIDY